jgi:hypothetical protein
MEQRRSIVVLRWVVIEDDDVLEMQLLGDAFSGICATLAEGLAALLLLVPTAGCARCGPIRLSDMYLVLIQALAVSSNTNCIAARGIYDKVTLDGQTFCCPSNWIQYGDGSACRGEPLAELSGNTRCYLYGNNLSPTSAEGSPCPEVTAYVNSAESPGSKTSAAGSNESSSAPLVVGIAVSVVLAFGLWVLYSRRNTRSVKESSPLQKSLLEEDGLEMGTCPRPSSNTFTQAADLQSPEFDPDEGVPVNDSAKALCAKQWTTHDLNSSFIGSAHHTTKVDYSDLQTATNNFEDSHKIGVGGSCAVYRGHLFGVPCAIKLLDQAASEWEEKQFTAEIDVLTRIKHENICQLYACSTNGPHRCVVLELMDIALDNRLLAEPALGWEQRVWIVVSER